MLIPGAKGRSV